MASFPPSHRPDAKGFVRVPRPDAKALGESLRLGGFGLRRTASAWEASVSGGRRHIRKPHLVSTMLGFASTDATDAFGQQQSGQHPRFDLTKNKLITISDFENAALRGYDVLTRKIIRQISAQVGISAAS